MKLHKIMKILSEQIVIKFRNKDLNIDPTLNVSFRIFLPKKEEQVTSFLRVVN